jgi:peptide/nickel transport system ATP-binding protein
MSEPDRPDSSGEALIRVKGLTKHYTVRARNLRSLASRRSIVHAVDDISFELYPGTCIALVGESGSGKSTVGRVLTYLDRPTSGEVLLRGKAPNLKRRSEVRNYRAQVQLILQDPYASLNPVHTVAYHLERPLWIHGMVKSKSEARATIIRLLEDVHLTPAAQIIDKLPHELSGGQRQRVAIARAVAVQPSVLVADEPVSMLDVSVRLSILNLLNELVTKSRLALLYITHDIASARYFAERLLVMYAGEILESGPSEEVTQSPAHPYTQLLISAAPDPDASARGTRRKMRAPGENPSLIAPPSGCRFHPRCPHAMDICAKSRPPRFQIDDSHWTSCWLFGDIHQTQPAAAADLPAPQKEVH